MPGGGKRGRRPEVGVHRYVLVIPDTHMDPKRQERYDAMKAPMKKRLGGMKGRQIRGRESSFWKEGF